MAFGTMPEHNAALRDFSERRSARVHAALDGLVARSLISGRDAESIAALIERSNESLDQAVCGLALVDEETLANAMAEIFSLPRLGAANARGEADIVSQMSIAFLRAHRVAPLITLSGEIIAAIADPTNLAGVEGCRFAIGPAVSPVIATATELEVLLAKISPQDEGGDRETPIEVDSDAARLRDLASAEPVVRLCNRLIADAHRARASDIHLEAEVRAYRVRLRIDGALIDRDTLSLRQGLAIVSRFKILSNLDIAERRRPQDGRFSFSVAGRAIDVRISSTPSLHGEGVVLRLLQKGEVALDLKSLGFSDEIAAQLYKLSDRPNGILLITGPTGSGKTTTLYTLLQRLAARDVKILTIEDPIEYQIEGISQTQANPAIGLTFASALRSFLRHDPDIIMVGEMRDLETARTAVQAALTGHLVLSTLHTNDAPSAVTRLIDMGVEDYLVASTLIGAVGQRLVRRICKACDGAPERTQACATCLGSGFYGRVAIVEVLEIDDALRPAIKRSAASSELIRLARAAGFCDMSADGEAKVRGGLTTRSEVEKAVVQ